ncbi:hypothetical protein GCM10009544_01780 [Streptomyces stramineus]|uniref:Transposase n=1 Tax=Streptomyces stramineus TaxID=173861 RepID=A0ABP3J5E3_9ACTN
MGDPLPFVTVPHRYRELTKAGWLSWLAARLLLVLLRESDLLPHSAQVDPGSLPLHIETC